MRFINPDHQAIRELAAELKDKEPIVSEVEWIKKNISYGMGGCLKLELELMEPVGLRTDYEVLQTREGKCDEQSFLLTSLLRARGLDAKIVYVSATKESYEGFIYGDLADPFDHVCVAVGDNLIDPVAGMINIGYDIKTIADDQIVACRASGWRNHGMVTMLKGGWIPVYNGIYANISDYVLGMVTKYSDIPYNLLEKWDLSDPEAKKISSEYFQEKNGGMELVIGTEISECYKEFLCQDMKKTDRFVKNVWKIIRKGVGTNPLAV